MTIVPFGGPKAIQGILSLCRRDKFCGVGEYELYNNSVYLAAFMCWNTYHTSGLDGKYLYRFLKMDHLLEFLEKKAIWFARADQFDDKMECALLSEVLGSTGYGRIVERQEKHLISCWHLADNESFAFWNTYAREMNGRKVAALRFLRRDLVRSIEDAVHRNDNFYYTRKFIHGGIRYRDLISIKSENIERLLVKHPAFRKENVFKFENEYRFVVRLTKKFSEKGFRYYFLQNPTPIFNVLLNPLLDNAEYKALEMEINEKGHGNVLARSELHRWLNPKG